MAMSPEISNPIHHVLIVGAGWVGRQVAARMAQYGVQVWLYDQQPSALERSLAWMQSLPGKPIESSSGAVDQNWLANVRIAAQLCVPDIQLVIESVPEQISLKKRVLRELSKSYADATIIASNSSYFTPSVLSRFVLNPHRFANFHFHHPVLVESVADIVGCPSTDSEVLDRLAELAQRIGQPALRLRHENPGYVFNWLLQSMLRASLELVAKDVVDPAEVDRAWKAVTKMPTGPFAIMDSIGLDVIEQVLSNARWADSESVSIDRLLAVLRVHIDQGHLGEKTQRGFYDYREVPFTEPSNDKPK